MPSEPFAAGHLPAYLTDAAQLPALLVQLVADLADPAVTYLLAGHSYARTHHPRARHFPAVFALRQGEVANVEVGPDFVAFDTALTRFPDWGERGYPGPVVDRFRATVPFAHLYRLCRQVLPAAQSADAVSYGLETVVYYNAAVHHNHPTPADMNHAAAAPPPDAHPLAAVLAAVAAGLADPANHYLVNTTSFDSPGGPVLLGLLHVHAHTVRDLVIGADAFTCAVLFDPHDRRQWSPVRVAFAQVWQVVRSDSPQVDLDEAAETGGILYEAPEVLHRYGQLGHGPE